MDNSEHKQNLELKTLIMSNQSKFVSTKNVKLGITCGRLVSYVGSSKSL